MRVWRLSVTQSISSGELFDLVKALAGAGMRFPAAASRVDSSAVRIEKKKKRKRKSKRRVTRLLSGRVGAYVGIHC